ncbi:MAG: MFS transporter [archaeon]|nr:MFS transporter [archaeon]
MWCIIIQDQSNSDENVGIGLKGSQKTKNYIIFLFVFLGIMEIFDTYATVFPTLLPSVIKAEFLISDAEFSTYLAIASMGTFLAIFIQFAADIWGRKRFLFISLIGMGIGCIVMLFSNSILQYMFAYFLLYIFYGADIYTIYAGEEAPKEKRAKYTVAVFTMGVVGGVITFILRVMVINEPYITGINAWKPITYFGVLAIPLALIVIKIKETTAFEKIKEERNKDPNYKKLSYFDNFWKPFVSDNRKSFIAILAITLIYGIAIAPLAMVEILYSRTFGLDGSELFILFALSVPGAIFGYLITGYLADKIGRKKTFIIYVLILPLSGIFAFIGVITPDKIIALLCFCMASILRYWMAQGLYVGIRLICVEILPIDLRGVGTAWKTIVLSIGTSLGFLINTSLIELINLESSSLILSFLFPIMAPIIYLFIKETKGIDITEEN